MLKYFLLILLVSISIIQTGCVGTIQDTATVATDSKIAIKGKINFAGIEKAIATAHNRIRVSFSPASGGTGKFSYLVYANGNFALPVASLSSTSATLDSLGKYSVDVKNLQLNTSYTFSVRVYDVGYEETDLNTVALSVRTLSEMVPVFDGAVSLQNLPGVSGLTNLLISWNVATPAFIDTSGFGNNVHNISGYSIYVGESEASLALVGTINDAAAKTYTISNLISGRTYYARVRAKNSAPTPLEDQNDTVVSRKTLISQPIQFAGVKSLSIPKTVEGFSNINIAWDAGVGTFDRYKILVFNSNPGAINPITVTPDQTIVVTDLDAISRTITVPTPSLTYYIAVIACSGDACTNYGGANVVKSVKTLPPLAPFNGIKSITALDLHSIQINWDKPDTTQGVYSTIKIFKSSASGIYNEISDEITSDPGATGLILDSITDTTAVLKNLVVDTEYCFVAMDYDNFYLSVEYPFGRSGTLRVRSCVTLRYTPPGFLGINASCTNPSSAGFTISWNKPSPMGIFDYYEIYVKDGNSGFNFSDAIAGDVNYKKLPPLSKDLTSYTFSQNSIVKLAADTYYQIGIKTFYNDSGVIRRDTNNLFTMNCKTGAASVEHKGWYEILGLGPKVNGLKAGAINNAITSTEVIAERLKPRGLAVDGLNEVRDLEYAQEWPGGDLGVDSSKQGIIKLIWNDFELTNGLGNLYNYELNHPGSVKYKVYRKAHASKYDAVYKMKVKATDTDWGSPVNTADIIPQLSTLPNGETLYFSQFIDYSLVHPYNADPSKVNEGSIYYYKVEAFINGNKVNYFGTYADAVVRVVLPPANMSFAHRWMLNKQICGEIGKTIANNEVDRENDYKCLYNGLGAVLDSGSYYYDMKGDLLTDRFKMGCNFSRGGTAKSCAEIPGSLYTNAASKIFFEGSTNDPAKDRIIGDCIGFGGPANPGTSPQSKIKAIPGAVFYDRASNNCFVNTTAPASLDGDGKGSTWQRLATIDTGETTAEGASKILPNTLSFVGEGWGQKIYSNNAYLPVLISGNQNNLYRTCQSNTVAVNGIDHRKRLMRRKEEIAAYAMSTFINQSSGTATAQKISAGTLMSGVNDRDCLSHTPPPTMYPSTATAQAAAELDLTKWNYPAAFGVVADTYNLNVVNGSAGSRSTEMCFSSFGLQDISGNRYEALADRFWCNGASTKDLCSSGIKDKNAITHPAKLDTELFAAQIYTPEIDPANKYNLKSANGHYLNFGNGLPQANGTNILTTTSQYQYINNAPADYKYFNPVLGVMLSCNGNSCQENGAYDDNTLVTTKSSSTLARIVSFPLTGNISSPQTSAITILPFVLNGYVGETTSTGRHSMLARNVNDGNISGATGRCTTLIEDYKEQSTQYNH